MQCVVGGILATFLVLGVAPSVRAGELVFSLNWLILGRHAPFVVALEKGFYKEEGLDIKIVRGFGSTDVINKLATGQATFAFGDTGSVIIARTKGAQARIVAMIYGKNPSAIYSLPEANIARPVDLEGKSIAAPPGDANRNMFPVFARLTGIDAAKVKWVTVDAAREAMLMAKKVDAITGFVLQIPILAKMAKAQNTAVSALKWADYGFELYSDALVVNDDFIASNPQGVRGFVRATIRGLRAAFEAPDEAIDIMLKLHPTLDREVSRAELDIVKSLVLTEDARRMGIGWINEKTMQTSVEAVADAFKVGKPSLGSLYTNEFLK
jgi:NitT/TauT family transport system substrate-binding protein